MKMRSVEQEEAQAFFLNHAADVSVRHGIIASTSAPIGAAAVDQDGFLLLYVQPEERQRGVGSALLNEVCHRMEDSVQAKVPITEKTFLRFLKDRRFVVRAREGEILLLCNSERLQVVAPTGPLTGHLDTTGRLLRYPSRAHARQAALSHLGNIAKSW